jgi:pimeloyl-ACP methyl ester carboxylesterase
MLKLVKIQHLIALIDYLEKSHCSNYTKMKILKPLVNILLLLGLTFNHCFAQTQNDPSQKQIKFFFPEAKLPENYKYDFPGNFTEISLKAKDNTQLNAVLFKSDSSKGVILYLHGNTGALDKWGAIAKTYTDLHYDLFMLDYRGYGKSEGFIKNESQLYSDVQDAYNYLKFNYSEGKIIVLGYSIGTGPAAFLAANNHPKELILQAPYYSLPDAIHHLRASFDTSKIAFHFNTYQFLKKITVPVFIFHGDEDKMFYYGSSEKLKAFFKPGDELIILKGAGHLDMDKNPEYINSLKRITQ